jgi:uncharacterized protein YceK
MPRSGVLYTLSIFLMATLSGCGTIMNLEDTPTTYFRRGQDEDPKRIYGGVQIIAERGWGQITSGPDPFLGMYWLLVDLPFSAAADTVTLPITIPATLRRHLTTPESVTPAATSASLPAIGQ